MDINFIYAILVVFIWGLVAIPIKNAKTSSKYGIGIGMVVGLILLIIPSMYIVFFRETNLNFSLTAWVFLFFVGLFRYTLGTYFYFECIHKGKLSVAVPFVGFKTLIVTLLVFITGLELITKNLFLAAVLATFGAIFLTYKQKTFSMKSVSDMKFWKGISFALLTALCWALSDIFIKPVSYLHPIIITVVSLIFGIISYLIYMLISKELPKVWRMPKDDIKRYAIQGIFSIFLSYILFYTSIIKIGVIKTNIITAPWFLITAIVGFFVYKEKFSISKIIGVVLIAASIILVFV